MGQPAPLLISSQLHYVGACGAIRAPAAPSFLSPVLRLNKLLLHQPGRRARVLQQLPSVKQYGAMPTGSQYCLMCSGFGMHAYRVGDKRVLSRATQHVHSTALHKLLLHQPGWRARVLGTSNQSSVDQS